MVKHILSAMFVAMTIGGNIVQAETIQGFPLMSPMPGLVQIDIQGDPVPHSGILISPNLALTGNRWFSKNTLPNMVKVTHGHDSNGQPDARFASDLWFHHKHPLALVRISRGFSNVPPVSYGALPTAGMNLLCFGFSQGRSAKRAELRVLGVNETLKTYVAVSRARTDMILDDGAGMPCFAEQNGRLTNTLTGIAVSTAGIDVTSWKHNQIYSQAFTDWVPNMIHLSRVKSTGAKAMNLYTRPDPNNLNLRMCLYISNNEMIDREVAQVPCSDTSTEQLFYFHNFQDSRNPSATHYTIVNHNGKCLEIPNSSKNPDVKAEAAPCDQGLNQDWEQSIYQPRPPEGIKLRQIFSNLCLSAPAPPNSSTPSLRIKQNPCLNSTTNFHQRWFIQWK